jgi:hypothetical protein
VHLVLVTILANLVIRVHQFHLEGGIGQVVHVSFLRALEISVIDNELAVLETLLGGCRSQMHLVEFYVSEQTISGSRLHEIPPVVYRFPFIIEPHH